MKIPFPYWLWEEIVLSEPPHNKMTIFRLVSVIMAVGIALGAYWIGRRAWGTVTGVILALPFLLLGYSLGYVALRVLERMLKNLVSWGVMAAPDFENHKPMN